MYKKLPLEQCVGMKMKGVLNDEDQLLIVFEDEVLTVVGKKYVYDDCVIETDDEFEIRTWEYKGLLSIIGEAALGELLAAARKEEKRQAAALKRRREATKLRMYKELKAEFEAPKKRKQQ